MRERPIIMSAESVRAILDGRKTQTRRVVKGIANPEMADRFIKGIMDESEIKLVHDLSPTAARAVSDWLRCPHGQPGDRLWVREGFRVEFSPAREAYAVAFKAGGTTGWGAAVDAEWCGRATWGSIPGTGEQATHWSSPLHMPRWASRLTLELTDVRVERVQDISEADAIAEGALHTDDECSSRLRWPQRNFAHIWDALNARRGYPWDSNPWVWVLAFKQVSA